MTSLIPGKEYHIWKGSEYLGIGEYFDDVSGTIFIINDLFYEADRWQPADQKADI